MKQLFLVVSVLWYGLFAGNVDAQNVSVVLTTDEGFSNQAIIEKMQHNLSQVLTEINRAQKENRLLNTVGLALNDFADRSLHMLWANIHFYCDDEEVVERCWAFGDGQEYMVSHIPLIIQTEGEEFGNGTTVSYDNLPYLTFVRGSNIDSDTNMLTLTFEVLGAAVDGDAYITLLYEAGNISNIDEEDVNFKIIDGKITVIDYLPGDINGDGNVNTKDLTRLMKYINHEDVEIF